MRKTIVRTITTTTIKSANVVFEKGVPVAKENPVIVLNGTIEGDKVLKEVRKTYGDYAQVIDTKEDSNTYEISVEDFIKYAKIVEPKETKEEPKTE